MKPLPLAKVLLVDDLEDNLIALEALLRRDDVTFLRATSGREALEHLLSHDVALALLDVNMPEMDGYELAELMRGTDRTRRVPIIFLTAGAEDAKRVFRGYEVGAVDFLYKPIDSVLLGHKVTTFVELYRERLERERLADELAQMLHMNEMFVAAASHDLRSPLSTVMMGVHLLERDVNGPGPRRTLSRIRSSTERVIRMLDQLHDLARARLGGGFVIHPRESNLGTIAEGLIEELHGAYAGRRILARYPERPLDGVWDDERIARMLSNLLGNALRHGAPERDVELRVEEDGPGWIVILVHNEGEIPLELRPHLFEPFRRGNAGGRDGLGLGLYIVRQIAAAHGGTVDVRSSAETGTTFLVRLPRVSSGMSPATSA